MKLSQIVSEFGPLLISNESPEARVEFISTGLISLDIIVGGGWPRGRVIHIHGPEGTGKTTLGLEACAAAQRSGESAVFIDMESDLTLSYAEAMGVDVSQKACENEKWALLRPPSGDIAADIMIRIVEEGAAGVIVLDSVAHMIPQVMVESEASDQQPALVARLMSRTLAKIKAAFGRCWSKGMTPPALILLNQERVDIMSYGSPSKPTGGMALRFNASIQLKMFKSGALKLKGKSVGQKVRMQTRKNKLTSPWQESEVNLFYGKGFDRHGDLIEAAKMMDVEGFEVRGAWIYLDGEQLGQGASNAALYLKQNPEVAERLRERVLTQFREQSEEGRQSNQDPSDGRESGKQAAEQSAQS